ncbi:MAG: VOC family protein [Bacteroidota bacterium]
MQTRPIASLFLTTFFTLVLSGCTPEASSSSTQEATPTARVAVDAGVIVADINASLIFYRDLLGLPVVADITTSLIGKGRMVQLKHGASLIKLVQMEAMPEATTATGITTTVGYRYITLMVEDMATIVAKTEAAGTPVFLPLTTLGNGAQIYMVEDPEGNIVEFVEEPV